MQQAEILMAQGGEDEAEVEVDFLNIHGKDDRVRLVDAARLEDDMEVLQLLTSSECPPPTQNKS
jgi:hypothetical protein